MATVTKEQFDTLYTQSQAENTGFSQEDLVKELITQGHQLEGLNVKSNDFLPPKTLEQETTFGGVVSHGEELLPFTTKEKPFGTIISSTVKGVAGIFEGIAGMVPRNWTQALFGNFAPAVSGDKHNLPPTLEAIRSIASGAMQKFEPGIQDDEAAFEATVNYIGQYFGHPYQNIKEHGLNSEAFYDIATDATKAFIKDPFGMFLMFSSALGMIGKTTGITAKALEVSGATTKTVGTVAKIGETLTKAGEVINPLTPIISGTVWLGEQSFNIAKTIAQNTIKLSEKQLSTYKGGVKQGGGAETFWNDFTNQVTISTKARLQGNAMEEINALGELLTNAAANSTGKINLQKIITRLDKLKTTKWSEGGVMGDVDGIAWIERAKNKLLNNEIIKGRTEISMSEGMEFKRMFDDLNRDWIKESPTYSGRALKGVADGMREQLSPEIRQLLQDQQYNILIAKAAGKATGGPTFTDLLLGVAEPGLGMTTAISRMPLVKTIGITGFKNLSKVFQSTPALNKPEILNAFNVLNDSLENQ